MIDESPCVWVVVIHGSREVGNPNDMVVESPDDVMVGINFGQSLWAHPVGKWRFFVNKNTKSPLVIFGSAVQWLLAWCVWNTHASIIASWTSARFCSACLVNSFIPLE